MKTDLEIYREEIDIIDRVIAESFEQRMEIVLKVAEYKRQNNYSFHADIIIKLIDQFGNRKHIKTRPFM